MANSIFITPFGGTIVGPVVIQGQTTMGGDLLFSPDNTYDIGAAGATSARTVYSSTSFKTNTGAAYSLAAPVAINTAPTIASGFGASPSIPNSNGTAAFTINVGTGGSASSGVLTMPAATTGWVLHCVNITNAATAVTTQTAGTTTSATIANYSRTTGLLTAWTASDVIRVIAMAY